MTKPQPKAQRQTRYEIHIVRADGSTEHVQTNSRRVDAAKRAHFIAHDRKGWPSVVETIVIDTMAWQPNQRNAHTYRRTNA